MPLALHQALRHGPRVIRRRGGIWLPLTLLDLPLQLPSLEPAMLWHERFHGDPAHAWVRQQLVDVVAAFDADDAGDMVG